MFEYRVVWKRKDLRRKTKRYSSLKRAERFAKLLGPEPWTGLGVDPDALRCCNGRECGCDGKTWREYSIVQRALMPVLEYVEIQTREVGAWTEIEKPIEIETEARP